MVAFNRLPSLFLLVFTICADQAAFGLDTICQVRLDSEVEFTTESLKLGHGNRLFISKSQMDRCHSFANQAIQKICSKTAGIEKNMEVVILNSDRHLNIGFGNCNSPFKTKTVSSLDTE